MAENASWLDGVERGEGPIYLAVTRALEAAIRTGGLQPGDRLPAQRSVADRLGIDLTTVTRAYALARERGLVEGAVGRGTFVRARADQDEAGLIDLSMNLPPPPLGLSLGAALAETSAAILRRGDSATLMAYHPGAGTLAQKAAGAAWLAPCLGQVAADRVLVAAGAQSALAAALSAFCRPGDAVVVEPLTYPGVKALARQLGLRLIPCAADEEGMTPEGLERACREERLRALYLVPTLQNPRATTMGPDRRRRIAELARAHDLTLIEDDPYSRLMADPPPALGTLAPERTVYIATLAKTLSPGLRVAFVVCPPGWADTLSEALRAVSLMPSPLMAAVAVSWIREGTAEALLGAIREEAAARRRAAALTLPQAVGAEEAIHVWLPMPARWSPQALSAAAQARGLALVTADAFAVADDHANGVRISLGGPAKRAVLERALAAVAWMVRDAPAPRRLVV